MDEEERYHKAKRRVAKLRAFYSNLITFLLVNVLLLVINLVLSPDQLWFFWVALIWGVILIVQAINTFTIRDAFLGDEWERKKIKSLLEEDQDQD